MSDVDISSPQVELLVRRENMNQSKIFTLLITGLLGIALVFMGLDLDIQIVIQTVKVEYLICTTLHTNIGNLVEANRPPDWYG